MKTAAYVAILLAGPAVGLFCEENQRAHVTQNEGENQTLAAFAFVNSEAGTPSVEHTEKTPPPWYASPEWWLVIIGFPTLFFLGWQALETKRAAKTARDGIVLAYRPKIIIRGITFQLGSILDPSKPTQIHYVVANVGGTVTTMVDRNLTGKRFDGPLPGIPPYSDDRNVLGTFKLKAGEYQERILKLDNSEGLASRFDTLLVADGIKITQRLYVFGFIEHRDEVGILRRTGFCRRYNIETKRFTLVEDPEYEYSD